MATQNLAQTLRHVSYEQLNRPFAEADFDRRVEDLCQEYYAEGGRPSIPAGVFFLYGPFNVDGEYTASSNASFDASLKSRDPGMGLRDMAELEELAARHQMKLEERLAMPANNFLLVFRKLGEDRDE